MVQVPCPAKQLRGKVSPIHIPQHFSFVYMWGKRWCAPPVVKLLVMLYFEYYLYLKTNLTFPNDAKSATQTWNKFSIIGNYLIIMCVVLDYFFIQQKQLWCYWSMDIYCWCYSSKYDQPYTYYHSMLISIGQSSLSFPLFLLSYHHYIFIVMVQ